MQLGWLNPSGWSANKRRGPAFPPPHPHSFLLTVFATVPEQHWKICGMVFLILLEIRFNLGLGFFVGLIFKTDCWPDLIHWAGTRALSCPKSQSLNPIKRELFCLCKQGQGADKISLVWTQHPRHSSIFHAVPFTVSVSDEADAAEVHK